MKLATALLLALIASCDGPSEGPMQAEKVRIRPMIRHQVIEGWGASMVTWRLSETPYATAAWRQAYRDLGLNIVRVNMKKDVLVDSSGDMSVPVFLSPELSSNLLKMRFDTPNVRVFGEMAAWLRANALEPDRVKVTAAVWSPPHWMKGPTGERQYHVKDPNVRKPTPWLSNGTTGDSIGGRLRQSEKNLEQFARYLAGWVKGFEAEYGVPIYAVSIQNELSFENPFDSATYAVSATGKREQWWQYANVLKAVKDEFREYGIETKVIGPHMAHLGKQPSNPWGLRHQMSYIEAVKAHTDRTLIDFLHAYNSNGYLGTDEDSVKMWAAYYHGRNQVPADWARSTKAPGIEPDGKPVWISEAGGAEAAWLTGPDHSPGNGAITVAQKVHNALVHANASAYVYWQLSDMHAEERRSTLLGKAHLASPTQSKKYAAFKHFARYVRPGAVRVAASFGNGQSSVGGRSTYDTYHALNVSAYMHEEDRAVTVVLVNMRPTNERVRLELDGGPPVKRLERYLTTRDDNFAKKGAVSLIDGRASLAVPGYSVITLHGTFAPLTSP